jgi:SAM-dependent methyltransferase
MNTLHEPSVSMELPFPPFEFRQIVGPTKLATFDNPTRGLVFPGVPVEAYESVLDFGCGCGRVARQLIQQEPRPARYVGIDRHAGMIGWCREHLAPHAPGFEFAHHDVHHMLLNPGGTPGHLPLPAGDGETTLFIAWSVFTHLLEEDAVFYLEEVARVLGPNGVAATTWFLFDKRDFPFMMPFQNALFVNATDPTNAVVFDRAWLMAQLDRVGLVLTSATSPPFRGLQWVLTFERQTGGRQSIALPEDPAAQGVMAPWGPLAKEDE